MQTRDYAIKYKALYNEIEIMLGNISEIGFNVDSYKEELKIINNSVSNNIKNNNGNVTYAKMIYEQDYIKGINELTKLKNNLDRYDCYYKTLNSCKWLEIKMNDKNISCEKLDKYVSEMICNLKQILSSDTIDYDNEKYIVESIYSTAYKLIKLELIITGKSELYLFIKNQDINISYFDVLIKEDISEIDLDDKKNIWLVEKIYEMKKEGINSTFFDIELIKRILINSDNINYKKVILDNINNTGRELEDSYKCIHKYLEEYEKINANKDSAIEYIKYNNEEVRKRLLTALLTITLMFTGSMAINKKAKNDSMCDTYIRTYESYSSIDGKKDITNDKIFSNSKPSDKTVIKVYDPYVSSDSRSYRLYDVSYQEFDDISKYLDFNIDEYGVVPTEHILTKDNGDIISNYKDSYRVVSSITYEYNGKELDVENYYGGLVFMYFLYLVVLFISEFIYANKNGKSLIISNIIKLIKDIPDNIDDLKRYQECNKKLKNNLDEIMNEINKNEMLSKKFNELYESNKYLLENQDELLKRIVSIKNNEVIGKAKKLVKDNRR